MVDLYRHFGKDNSLLYVGVSLTTVKRLAEHRRGSSWFGEIIRIDIEKFKSREDALAAEQKAIKKEKPRYNVHHQDRAKIEKELDVEELEIANEKLERARITLRNRITVSVRVAREVTGLGKTKIYDMIAKAELDALKIGGKRLIRVKSLLEILGEHDPYPYPIPTHKRRAV